jgi:hypothetical protein
MILDKANLQKSQSRKPEKTKTRKKNRRKGKQKTEEGGKEEEKENGESLDDHTLYDQRCGVEIH